MKHRLTTICAVVLSCVLMLTVCGCTQAGVSDSEPESTVQSSETESTVPEPVAVSFCEIDDDQFTYIYQCLADLRHVAFTNIDPASKEEIQEKIPDCAFYDVPGTEYSFSPIKTDDLAFVLILQETPYHFDELCGSFYMGPVIEYDKAVNAGTYQDFVSANGDFGDIKHYNFMSVCAMSLITEFDEFFDYEYFDNTEPLLICTDQGLCVLQLKESIFDTEKESPDYDAEVAFVKRIDNPAFSYAYACTKLKA